MCNWEVARSISPFLCISFFLRQLQLQSGHVVTASLSSLKDWKFIITFLPSFLPVPLTLWEAGGGKSCSLLHLWLTMSFCGAECCQPKSGCSYKLDSSFLQVTNLFTIPSSQLSQFFLHLCSYFLKLYYNQHHSFETLLAAAPLKQGFLLSQTMFSWQVKISRGSHGLYVISVCIQTAGLHFILFAFSNKLLFFSCKMQIIKSHQTLSIETKNI